MQSTRWLVPFACAGIAWALIPFGTAHAADCGALAAVALPHTTITSAVTSDIRFEVWLPLAHWNGKFQGVGNGGLGGVISYVVCETE